MISVSANLLRVMPLLFLAGVFPAVAVSQNATVAEVISAELRHCYASPDTEVAEGDIVALDIQLNTEGDIDALPDVHINTPPTAGERALLKAATMAILTCAPFTVVGQDQAIHGTFTITVLKTGLAISSVSANFVRLPPVDATTENTVENASSQNSEKFTEAFGRADVITEAELAFSKTRRKEIQRRLVLLNYNTRGVDGVFGAGTRAAIENWQADNDFLVTGFLNKLQADRLFETSQQAYATWQNRPRQYYDAKGCLRESNGQIVEGRSFGCDLSALGQNMGLSN